MSATSGVDAQVLTLPKGGGAVSDMGASFETDLNTGTGSYAFSLTLPSGPDGIAPQLRLRYSSGAGNGSFGVGWTFGVMSISRKTDAGVPTYAPGDDAFVLPGVDDLLDVGGGAYRPRVDTMFYRILRKNPGWEVTDTTGNVHVVGASAAARIGATIGGNECIGAWLLESMTTPSGYSISYEYVADGSQRYLSRIAWGRYELRLVYEPRPDRLIDGRYGYVVETNQRCSRIELHSLDASPTVVRSWNLSYTLAEPAGLSLLASITVRGHAADGSTLDAPAAKFGYTSPAKPKLARVKGAGGASPPPFKSAAVELVDWDGDGLPELFELNQGRARVWRNLGRNRWGLPFVLTAAPGPLSLSQPGIAFADVLGNGTVDFINFATATARYVPVQPGGGFGRAQQLTHAPRIGLPGETARFADLDGDGRTDVLTMSREFIECYYRENGGYSERPQTIPRTNAPPVDISDPHVRLADMTGDGLQDLVRFDGASVRYWPYLGYGKWADAIELQNPPVLPRNFDARRLFIVDVDGDGCADFVYVDNGSVSVWHNRGGRALSNVITIPYTPAASIDNVRLVDFNATGTIGVLWSDVPDGPVRRGYVYLDLCGGVKPYLLQTIDNGIGSTTTIQYRTSTEFAIDSAESHAPWSTFHPFPVQCVARTDVHDEATGLTSTTRYVYGPARYDSALRAFLGFGVVDTITEGDASIPAQRTRNTYHLGIDPNAPSRPLSGDDLLLFGALRRRLLKTEIFAEDGDPSQDKPYRVGTHEYAARIETASNGARIGVGYELRAAEMVYERTATAFSTHEIQYAAPDAFGNIPSQRMIAQRAGVATPDIDVTTTTTFAQNLAAHIVSLPARVTQRLADGTLASAKLTYYDGPDFTGLPEGAADKGHVSRIEVLAYTDAMVTAMFGSAPPDFASLGYLRHAGEDGWWMRHVAFARRPAPAGLTLVRRNQRGDDAQIIYDATNTRPRQFIDELGNTTTAGFDARALQDATLTDGSGATTSDLFDPLGRVIATVSTGDSPALPSSTFEYRLGETPYALATKYRVTSGNSQTFDEIEYFDGRGQRIAGAVPGEGDAGRAFIVRNAVTRNSRGLEATLYEPYYAADAAYHAPPAATPATTLRYDALGRLLERKEANGAITRYAYAPGSVTIANSFEGGSITRTTVQHTDALGRILSIERELAGRTIRQTYTYTPQSHIATATDADAKTTSLAYDLLGRLIVNASPDTGLALSIADAAGNVVETRNSLGERVVNTFDKLSRIVTTGVAGAAAEVTYHYLNAGDPLPPDGERNRRTRLWRIDDAVGSWTYAYDARGQIVQQTRTVKALPGRSFTTDFVLDDLGRQIQTTLPEPSPGAGRRVVGYAYGPRGMPVASAGYVKAAEYDTRGRITRLVYQNGVENRWQYIAAESRRIQHLTVTAPDGTVLRDQTFSYDDAGNTTAISGPMPLERGTFTYDDFDRLTSAAYGDGNAFSYAYSDGGTSKPPAGSTYAFDAAGRMQQGPFGSLAFDAFDRLTNVTRPDGTSEQYLYDFSGMRCSRVAADGTVYRTIDASLEFVNDRAVVWVSFAKQRIAAFSGAQALFVHYDQLNVATLFTDGTGAEVRRLAFGPYGTVRHDSAAGDIQPQFANGTVDTATTLICMGRRYVDPALGRFISPDVLVAGAFSFDGWNRYVYARNNPLRYIDPSGLLSWQDVLAIVAIVVIIIVLCVAAYFTGGATLAAIPGVMTMTWGGLFVSTAIGVAAGAIIGGIAAAQAGGDLWKGILFGGVMGGISAFAGGCFGAAVLGSMSSLTMLGYIAIGAVEGATIGMGTGAAVGYAGGKGTAESILKHMLAGFITGAVIGAALGVVSSVIAGEGANAALKIGTFDKYTGAAGSVTTSSNVMAFGQNSAELIAGGNPSGLAGSFIGIGQSASINSIGDVFNVSANGALVSIPIGWVPSAILTSGGMVAIEGISTSLDASGAYSIGNQLVLALSFVPFVGMIFGYGIGEDSSWEGSMENWLNNNFSQSSANVI